MIAKLDKMVATIEDEVKTAIHAQAKTGFRAREDLDEAKAAMADLLTRVKSVQQKSQQSETLVLEFCRNLKFLDLAKKNLLLQTELD